MNQTKKRLHIINHAISITDYETIQLQIIKLSLLIDDERIKEIIEKLQNKNYIQAQQLINIYIETPNEEITQRTSQNKYNKKSNTTDKETIEEFNLLSSYTQDTSNQVRVIELDEMLDIESKSNNEQSWPLKKEPIEVKTLDLNEINKIKKESQDKRSNNFDTLLNVDKSEILPNNIKIDIDTNHTINRDFWDKKPDIKKDTAETKPLNEIKNSITPSLEQKNIFKEKDSLKDIKVDYKNMIDYNKLTYKAMPYIKEKIQNIKIQYPPEVTSDTIYESTQKWIDKISNDGYSEVEVEEIMQKIDNIRADKKDEAAQLLLISAATKSKYAHFRLARTLYKGDILKQNVAEAFMIINKLAENDNYPEAICDLGQFYEHGVGVKKDTDKAQELYREAMDSGIKRAKTHFERLDESQKGLFSFLKK